MYTSDKGRNFNWEFCLGGGGGKGERAGYSTVVLNYRFAAGTPVKNLKTSFVFNDDGGGGDGVVRCVSLFLLEIFDFARVSQSCLDSAVSPAHYGNHVPPSPRNIRFRKHTNNNIRYERTVRNPRNVGRRNRSRRARVCREDVLYTRAGIITTDRSVGRTFYWIFRGTRIIQSNNTKK